MTDNIAVLAGFTREVTGECTEYVLHLLVKPDTDLGQRFEAWDMDEQEWMMVNGWLFTFEEPETITPQGWTEIEADAPSMEQVLEDRAIARYNERLEEAYEAGALMALELTFQGNWQEEL